MNPDDCQSVFREAFVPIPVPGIIANAVDSLEGIEVNGDDLAFEVGKLERFRVDPTPGLFQFWCFEGDPRSHL